MRRLSLALALLLVSGNAQAACWLKLSTAVDVKLGPFLDDTDGKTAETALTLSQADIRLAKNAGSWAQKGDSNACTHEENGYYECALNTTDTGTLGILMIAVAESGALQVGRTCLVLPAMIYDSLVAGTDRLDTNVTHVGDTAQTAGDIPALIVTVDDFVDTEVAAIKAKTDNLPSDPADDSDLDGQLAAIQADTDNLQTRVPAALTADSLMKCDTLRLGGMLQTAGDLVALLNTIDDFIDTEIAAIKAKTDGLPSDPADASDLAAALTAIDDYVDTEVAAILAAVDTEVAAIKAKTDGLPSDPADASDLAALIAALQADSDTHDTDAEIAAAVWNALKAAYGIANSYGEHVEGLSSGGSCPTVAQIWAQVAAACDVPGTICEAVNNAAAAGDPMSSDCGSYSGNQCGAILGRINSATITFVNPISPDGKYWTAYKGDDYLESEGTEFAAEGDWWPELTGATVYFEMPQIGLQIEGTVNDTRELYVEIPHGTFLAVEPAIYSFHVWATLATGSERTLIRGRIEVATR